MLASEVREAKFDLHLRTMPVALGSPKLWFLSIDPKRKIIKMKGIPWQSWMLPIRVELIHKLLIVFFVQY